MLNPVDANVNVPRTVMFVAEVVDSSPDTDRDTPLRIVTLPRESTLPLSAVRLNGSAQLASLTTVSFFPLPTVVVAEELPLT